MKLGNYIKFPAERKRYAIDYTDWLDTGETLTAVTYTVSPGTDLVVDASSISSSGLVAVFFVSGGTAGTVYTIDVRATTSGGQIKEDTVLFTLRSAS
jgi:hypothetical protein